MKISIVIAYYNRRKLFIKTLESISKTIIHKDWFEIIVVDDGSDEQECIDDLADVFCDLNIRIIKIIATKKWWTNPCIPYNIGFEFASGDVIIIQNPECLHLGDIVDYVINNIEKNKYLVFGCYAIGHEKTNLIYNVNIDDPNYLGIMKTFVKSGKWYQHSKFNPRGLNFCSAITRVDLDDLGGFDEKFAKGIAKDDREFVFRVDKKGMNIIMVDSPFVIHQFHVRTNYSNSKLVNRNNKLFSEIVKKNEYRINNKLTYDLINTVIEK
jgi:glycosyltransferase involved in cell wall biosynthesis